LKNLEKQSIFINFFIQLASIVNIVGGSSKCHDLLQSTHADDIESLIASNEIETGRGEIKLVLCNGQEILDGHLIFTLFVA
jgi:hypothetical protein